MVTSESGASGEGRRTAVVPSAPFGRDRFRSGCTPTTSSPPRPSSASSRASRTRAAQRLRRRHDERAPRWLSGYMAQPLQMASFVLEEHPTGWAAAAPLFFRSVYGACCRGGRMAPRPPSRSCRTRGGRRRPPPGFPRGGIQPDRIRRSLQGRAPPARRAAARKGSGRARGGPGAARLPTGSGPRGQRGRVVAAPFEPPDAEPAS